MDFVIDLSTIFVSVYRHVKFTATFVFELGWELHIHQRTPTPRSGDFPRGATTRKRTTRKRGRLPWRSSAAPAPIKPAAFAPPIRARPGRQPVRCPTSAACQRPLSRLWQATPVSGYSLRTASRATQSAALKKGRTSVASYGFTTAPLHTDAQCGMQCKEGKGANSERIVGWERQERRTAVCPKARYSRAIARSLPPHTTAPGEKGVQYRALWVSGECTAAGLQKESFRAGAFVPTATLQSIEAA